MKEFMFDDLDIVVEDPGVTAEIIADTGFLNSASKEIITTFCGAIVCESGSYRGHALMMKLDEKIAIGVDQKGDIEIDDARMCKKCCEISYDKEYKEYLVEPNDKNTIFLMSGQPLGKGRTYFIPRGMQLKIGNGNITVMLG